MSYKDEMKREVQMIVSKPSSVPTLHKYIEALYERAVYESRKTGQSIESVTYEILEGLEASAEVHSDEMETLLVQSALIMIDVMHLSGLKTLERSNQKVMEAKKQRKETLKAEKAYLLETLHTLKEYAQDNSHLDLKKSLQQRQSDIIEKICMLSDLIENVPIEDAKENI